MTTPMPPLTIPDYEARARETMPRALFERLFGSYGGPTMTSNTNNLAALEAIKLRPRVLADVSRRDLSTEVLGRKITFPIMLAPSGDHQRSHPQGELATARAAGAAGTIMSLSTASSYSMEEVVQVASGPLWFQLYFFRDRKLTEILVRRAQQAGYSALVLTVDNVGAQPGGREYSYGVTLEPGRIYKNFVGIELPDLPGSGNFNANFDPALNWSHLEWLRSLTTMPLVIKGIQTAEDARLCAEYGVEGLIVSNHGGRYLEGALGTIDMLPEVVAAVGDKVQVFIDGGIRRGTDVLKCLALGAKAVLIGRPVFWGLSVNGEAGLSHVLDIYRDELDTAMGLCGLTDVKKADPSLLSGHDGGSRIGGVLGPLERLAKLLEQGHLTRDEFDALKAQLIGRLG